MLIYRQKVKKKKKKNTLRAKTLSWCNTTSNGQWATCHTLHPSDSISQTRCDAGLNILWHRNPLTPSSDPWGSLKIVAQTDLILSSEEPLSLHIAAPCLRLFLSPQLTLWGRAGDIPGCYKPLARCPPPAVLKPRWEYINFTDTTTSRVTGIKTHFHCVRGSCIIIRFIDLWELPATIWASPKLESKKIKVLLLVRWHLSASFPKTDATHQSQAPSILSAPASPRSLLTQKTVWKELHGKSTPNWNSSRT